MEEFGVQLIDRNINTTNITELTVARPIVIQKEAGFV